MYVHSYDKLVPGAWPLGEGDLHAADIQHGASADECFKLGSKLKIDVGTDEVRHMASNPTTALGSDAVFYNYVHFGNRTRIKQSFLHGVQSEVELGYHVRSPGGCT